MPETSSLKSLAVPHITTTLFSPFLGAGDNPEQFMVKMLKCVDKNDQGCVSFEQASQGFKEYDYPILTP